MLPNFTYESISMSVGVVSVRMAQLAECEMLNLRFVSKGISKVLALHYRGNAFNSGYVHVALCILNMDIAECSRVVVVI